MTADFHPVAVGVLAVCNQPAPEHFSRVVLTIVPEMLPPQRTTFNPSA
jgi:hypothetical protein